MNGTLSFKLIDVGNVNVMCSSVDDAVVKFQERRDDPFEGFSSSELLSAPIYVVRGEIKAKFHYNGTPLFPALRADGRTVFCSIPE